MDILYNITIIVTVYYPDDAIDTEETLITFVNIKKIGICYLLLI